MNKPQQLQAGAGAPWWRFPMVWFVISGPALVVVAGVTTVVIAYKNVDPVLEVKVPATAKPNEVPALTGRNRAAEVAVRPAEH